MSNLDYTQGLQKSFDEENEALKVTISNKLLSSTENDIDETNSGPAQAELELYDLTYFAVNSGSAGNDISIEYQAGGTAGDETVEVNGTSIVVIMEDGVSTADDIVAAIEASEDALALISVAISGTGSNPQDATPVTNLGGGSDAPIQPVNTSGGSRMQLYALSNTAIASPPTLTVQISPVDTGDVWLNTSLTAAISTSEGTCVAGTALTNVFARRARVISNDVLNPGESVTVWLLIGA